MAKLYGLGNYLMTEIVARLLNNKEFTKFVYYKNVSDEDILTLPDLDNPVAMLKDQFFRNRRSPKILEEQDVTVFIYLDDMKNSTTKSNRIKTLWINIGLIVHESCSDTLNGSREVAIISAIEKALSNMTFSKALGVCEVERVIKLNGIPFEWNGYEVSLRLDGFSEVGTNIFEVENE